MIDATRVGILGGTFDPIHIGHLAAARVAQQALLLTDVCFIPSHHPPHRPGRPLASGPERLAMIEGAIAGTPGWRASDLELQRRGASYTYDTLMALQRQGLTPDRIFFIIGADAFAEIASWSRYPAVLDAANFVVIARSGISLTQLPQRLPDLAARMGTAADTTPIAGTRIVLVEADTPDVSATEVRERAGAGADISTLVPPAVAAFITAHGLYRASDGSRSTAVATGR